MTRRHSFGAQCVPLIWGHVVCLHCGKVVKIGDWPTGRRAKCSPTRRLIHIGDGGTGSTSEATKLSFQRSPGHSGYYRVKAGYPPRFRSHP